MINNLTKHIPLTTIIIAYFFVCGGLYIIGFWGLFNIDVTNFISLSDIPKSFIMPFVISQGYSLFNLIINAVTSDNYLDDPPTKPKLEPALWKRIFKALTSLDILILFSFPISYNLYYYYKFTPFFWYFTAILFSYLFSFKFDKSKKMRDLFPFPTLRFYILTTIISVPLLSFALGRGESLNVYFGKSTKYLKFQDETFLSNKQKMKFIGFIGDKVIGGNQNNTKLYFINQSSYPVIEIDSQ